MDELIQKLEILASEYARNSQMASAGFTYGASKDKCVCDSCDYHRDKETANDVSDN